MKWILPVTVFLISIETIAQTGSIKIIKSTAQKVTHGAAPGSTVTYRIEFKKTVKNEVRIDSVLTAADHKKVDFYLFRKKGKAEIPFNGAVIPRKDKSVFVLTFGETIHEDFERRGRPVEPSNEPSKDFSQGVVIFYMNNKKQETITVKDFKIIEEINAP